MMTIKFRAWDGLLNQWIAKGFHIIGETTMFSLIDIYCHEHKEGKDTIDRYGDIVIDQYTGRSINGKDIYCGDILSARWKVEVYQDEKYGTYMVRFPTSPGINKPCPLYDYIKKRRKAGTDDLDLEIIGNIHQTPNLL